MNQGAYLSKTRSVVIIGAICFTASGFQAPGPQASAPKAAPSAAATTTPARELVTKYCVSCHNQKLKTANLMLDNADAGHVSNSAETWEKVIVKLRSRSMPPPGIPRPDNATYNAAAC
jgi:cytochrome c5